MRGLADDRRGDARGDYHIESPAMTSLAAADGGATHRPPRRQQHRLSDPPRGRQRAERTQFARRAQGLESVPCLHPSLARCSLDVRCVYEGCPLQICGPSPDSRRASRHPASPS
ncbi:MAG: hypothetical protein R3F31_11605 [Verrucomicrobiales bacterium]